MQKYPAVHKPFPVPAICPGIEQYLPAVQLEQPVVPNGVVPKVVALKVPGGQRVPIADPARQ